MPSIPPNSLRNSPRAGSSGITTNRCGTCGMPIACSRRSATSGARGVGGADLVLGHPFHEGVAVLRRQRGFRVLVHGADAELTTVAGVEAQRFGLLAPALLGRLEAAGERFGGPALPPRSASPRGGGSWARAGSGAGRWRGTSDWRRRGRCRREARETPRRLGGRLLAPGGGGDEEQDQGDRGARGDGQPGRSRASFHLTTEDGFRGVC